MDRDYFEDFWEASNLDRFNVKEFASMLNKYDSDTKELGLAYPSLPIELPNNKTRLNKIAKKRKSTRSFSNKKMSDKDLGTLMSSFYAINGLEHRGYPSAGATYVTELFIVGFNLSGRSGKAYYYDPESHGIIPVSNEVPSWEKAQKLLNIETDGVPGALFIFVIFSERATAKYGERGGRFALLETGAAMQQLALQIATSDQLNGVIVGGMLDSAWKKILKLEETNAKIALGYLVGK